MDFKTFRCSTPSSVSSHERKSRFELRVLKNKFRDYRQTSNVSSRDVMSKYIETSLSKKNKQS